MQVVAASTDSGFQDVLEFARIQRVRALRLLDDLDTDSNTSAEDVEADQPSHNPKEDCC